MCSKGCVDDWVVPYLTLANENTWFCFASHIVNLRRISYSRYYTILVLTVLACVAGIQKWTEQGDVSVSSKRQRNDFWGN